MGPSIAQHISLRALVRVDKHSKDGVWTYPDQDKNDDHSTKAEERCFCRQLHVVFVWPVKPCDRLENESMLTVMPML